METTPKRPVIVLFDDGTLDTVIGCATCGEWLSRATPEAWEGSTREDFIAQEIADWQEWHACGDPIGDQERSIGEQFHSLG